MREAAVGDRERKVSESYLMKRFEEKAQACSDLQQRGISTPKTVKEPDAFLLASAPSSFQRQMAEKDELVATFGKQKEDHEAAQADTVPQLGTSSNPITDVDTRYNEVL